MRKYDISIWMGTDEVQSKDRCHLLTLFPFLKGTLNVSSLCAWLVDKHVLSSKPLVSCEIAKQYIDTNMPNKMIFGVST